MTEGEADKAQEVLAEDAKEPREVEPPKPRSDIQAILTVLGRRETEKVDGREELGYLHLGEADLRGAVLLEANLSGAYLFKADLSEANLREANLSRAYLFKADLSEANLGEADLSEADLREADLRGASFADSILFKVYPDVRNLTQEQIDSARGNAETQLPEGLERPAHWK